MFCYKPFLQSNCKRSLVICRNLSLSKILKYTDVDKQAQSNPAKPKKAKTPIGKLDELEEGKHPYQEKEPLPAWPDNTNPNTGEVGGPRGPEPTRFGDWERKGRVTDF